MRMFREFSENTSKSYTVGEIMKKIEFQKCQ